MITNNNIIIANKYYIVSKINEGAFGTIYKGLNKRTNNEVAIKIEPINNDFNNLKREAKIYQYLGKLDGFPELRWYGSTNTVNYLVIDLLGNSLTEIINNYTKLSLKTALLCGIQIIKRIQTLHKKQLLHRDIKPSNFLFGLKENTNKIFLCDLGFCKRYNYDGKHISNKKIKTIIGTPNFVSLNVHNLNEPSRRDDIESCIYIIITMFLGRLEWFNITNISTIYTLKRDIVLSNAIPLSIKNILKYIRELKFEDEPNYELIMKLLMDECKSNGFENDNCFEWSRVN